MDLEFFRNDDATAEMVKDKCLDILNDINWKEQVNFTDETTIDGAIELALEGLDGGLEGTYRLQPDDLQFHKWMRYAYLCTILYNRNRQQRRFTILRKCFNHCIPYVIYNKRISCIRRNHSCLQILFCRLLLYHNM